MVDRWYLLNMLEELKTPLKLYSYFDEADMRIINPSNSVAKRRIVIEYTIMTMIPINTMYYR